MFSKKKTECRVCGYRFTPEREALYTAEEPRSALEMLTAAPVRFSAVDCPSCGCQIRLADRAPRVIFDELMKRSTAFLKGGSKERRLLPLLYMIDDVEKWNDLEELKKANPNMGVSVSPDFFKEEIAVAEMSMSKRAEFLTKYCNIKQNSSVAWLDYVVVDGAGIHAKLEDFKDSYAVGGIDLSQTTDLTAASVVIERDGVLYAFAQFFMPANRLETAQAIDGVPYDIFVKQGIVKLSGENHVDYRDVYEWFSMLRDQYGIYILKIGYRLILEAEEVTK